MMESLTDDVYDAALKIIEEASNGERGGGEGGGEGRRGETRRGERGGGREFIKISFLHIG